MFRISLFLATFFSFNSIGNCQQSLPNIDSIAKRHADLLKQHLDLNNSQYYAILKLEHRKLIIIDSIQKNGYQINVESRKLLIENMNSEYDRAMFDLLSHEQFIKYDAYLKIQKQRALSDRDKLKGIFKPL